MFFGEWYKFGTSNWIVWNSFDLNFEKNSGTYPTDIAPNVSPWYPFFNVAIFVLFSNPIFFQYCNAILIETSIAVEPLSVKKTELIPGQISINFFDRISDDSFVKLNNGECCNFFVCLIIALTNSFLEWPQTLHHILATPSKYFVPWSSISHIPLPRTIVVKFDHSDICVFGCQSWLFFFNIQTVYYYN